MRAINAYGLVITLFPVTLFVGFGLLWFARKRLSGRLRLFVMLIGGALVVFLLAVLLHNGISVLAGRLLGIADFEEPVFFILAVIVCPLAVLVGIVGALVTWLKGRRVESRGQGA